MIKAISQEMTFVLPPAVIFSLLNVASICHKWGSVITGMSAKMGWNGL